VKVGSNELRASLVPNRATTTPTSLPQGQSVSGVVYEVEALPRYVNQSEQSACSGRIAVAIQPFLFDLNTPWGPWGKSQDEAIVPVDRQNAAVVSTVRPSGSLRLPP
jgi:hypothetical protein